MAPKRPAEEEPEQDPAEELSRTGFVGVLRGAAAAELCEALLLVAAEGIDWRAPGRQLSTQPLQCGRARRLVCVLEETQKVKRCITSISYQEKRRFGGTSRWGSAPPGPRSEKIWRISGGLKQFSIEKNEVVFSL